MTMICVCRHQIFRHTVGRQALEYAEQLARLMPGDRGLADLIRQLKQ